jgi:hypothetical protein
LRRHVTTVDDGDVPTEGVDVTTVDDGSGDVMTVDDGGGDVTTEGDGGGDVTTEGECDVTAKCVVALCSSRTNAKKL